jgi:predicted PurR-regulated permease PerM
LFFEVVILTFSAIMIAVLLSVFAAPLGRRLKIQRCAAVFISALFIFCITAATAYLFGTRLAIDIQVILSRMEAAQNSIRASLQSSEFGEIILSHLGAANIPITQIATSVFSISARLIAAIVVAVIAGIYLAAQPSLYLNGFLALFPRERRSNAEDTARAVGNGLYRWLEGQFISMLLVGLLSALATWAIGLPSPSALGLIAGITEFIPYVGPIIASIPALLVAATQSPNDVLWTIFAYITIHLTEGNLIEPLIQRQMVYVPPAIMLLGIASISIVFGTVAIIFAAPIVVVVFVLIKKLYVRDSLGEPTALPGENSQQ